MGKPGVTIPQYGGDTWGTGPACYTQGSSTHHTSSQVVANMPPFCTMDSRHADGHGAAWNPRHGAHLSWPSTDKLSDQSQTWGQRGGWASSRAMRPAFCLPGEAGKPSHLKEGGTRHWSYV